MDKLIEKYLEQARLLEGCREEIIDLQKKIAESPLGKELAAQHKRLGKCYVSVRKAKKRLDRIVLTQFKLDGNHHPHPCIKIRTYTALEREWGIGDELTVHVLPGED